MDLNLNNKTFASLANSENGEVSDDTRFFYKQEGTVVWAEYGGGDIIKGFLIGQVIQEHLEFIYQHLNRHGELMSGKCTSYPEQLADGKIKLNEQWQWTCKDFSSGQSVLVEV